MTRARKPKVEVVGKTGAKAYKLPAWIGHPLCWLTDAWAVARNRKRIYIGFAVLVVGGLYLPTIRYMNAKPMIVAQCDTNAYAEALILRATCSSTEHCTKREITNAEAIKTAIGLQWTHCNAEPPTRPDQHVWRAAHSVVQASADAYRDWQSVKAIYTEPPVEVEEVIMAER